jgi:hypothetical protein
LATPRKHWFRVADAVLNKPWTNNELAALVRLMAYLNTRWARSGLDPDEACEADIPTVAVMQITGRGRADVARSSLERLAILAGISVEIKPEVCSIKWPKWAEFQEYRSRKRPGIARELPRPQTHTHTHTQEEKKKEPAAAAAPPSQARGPGNGKAKKSAFPEPFPLDLRADLLTWAKARDFTEQQVSDAIERVGDWAVSNGKLKASWVRTIQGAMREGWALQRNSARSETPDQRIKRMAKEFEEERKSHAES